MGDPRKKGRGLGDPVGLVHCPRARRKETHEEESPVANVRHSQGWEKALGFLAGSTGSLSVAALSAIDQHHEGRRVEEGTAGSPGSAARATADPHECREARSPGSAKPSELRRSALMATRGEANDTRASTL